MHSQNQAGELVSILTPSFNQEQFLGTCLASVASQSYPRIEHVVRDGGSTDGSAELLREVSRTRPLNWHSEPDRGQSDALNKAFRASSGEIIGWLNSDDAFATPDAVADVVTAFRRDPSAGVLFGHALLTDASGRILRLLMVPAFNRGLLLKGCFIYQPTVFIRRSVLDQYGFVRDDLQFVMDYELWLRLSGNGVKFIRLDEFVAIDRHHPGRKVERAWGRVVQEADSIRPRSGLRGRIWWLLVNAVLRERAITALPRLYRASLLPSVRLPSTAGLLLRQLAVPRRFM